MWRTDATLLQPGAIVKLRQPPDSKGRATADHWFVVISPTAGLKAGDILTAVAISSSLRPEQLDPDRHYPLRHRAGPAGHPDTGLHKPSWACIDWAHGIEVLEGDEFDLEVSAQFDYRFIGAADLRALIALRDAWVAKRRSRRRPSGDSGRRT